MTTSENGYELVTRLFDQLKGASDRTDRQMESLTENIREYINSSKVTNDDLDVVLGDINKDLAEKKLMMVDCKHTHSLCKGDVEEIKLVVQSLNKKIWAMIAVVVIAFGLMVTSYIFVRNSITDMIDRRLHPQKIEEVEKRSEEIYNRLDKMMDRHETTTPPTTK